MKRLLVILGMLWILLALVLVLTQTGNEPQIHIKWETESELDTTGFNILRSESPDGTYTRVNDTIIPAADDPIAGGSYEFIDTGVQLDKVYYYRLEDVEYDNSIDLHETIEASVEGTPWWVVVLILLCAAAGIIMLFGAVRLGQNNNRVN